jgi:hypothetical protein
MALKSLLMAHGMVMNGGVVHCHESLEPHAIDDAIAGFRWFGLGEVADLLTSTAEGHPAGGLDEAASLAADDSYNSLIPTDGVVEAAFRQRLQVAPEAFSPLPPE